MSTWRWALLSLVFLAGLLPCVWSLSASSGAIFFQSESVGALPVVDDANAVFLVKDEKALQKLADLEEDIERMRLAGIRTVRVTDGLIVAQSIYQTERVLVKDGVKENFSDTSKKVDEMLDIIDLAYEAQDVVFALETHLGEVKSSIDTGPVDELLASAKKEMRDERFEKAIESATAGENKIIELQSLDTKAKAAAEAATSNIISFLDTNKFNIVGILVVFGVLFLIFRNRLRHFLATARIRALELERDTLRDEIRRAQEDFFVKGAIPESIYKIRIKVFNTMIRTITQKIAVAYEAQKKSEFLGFFHSKRADNNTSLSSLQGGDLKKSPTLTGVRRK